MSSSSREFSPLPSSQEIRSGAEQIHSLNYIPGMQQLLYQIRSDSMGGEPFRRNLRGIGILLANYYAERFNPPHVETVEGPFGQIPRPVFQNHAIIFGIPRGGRPFAEGIQDVLAGSTLIFTNDGDKKDPTQPLLPSEFTIDESVSDILIADTVLGSGDTMLRNINAVKNVAHGRKIYLLTAIALYDFEDKGRKYGLKRVLQEHPDLIAITGCLESKAEWKVRADGPHLFVHGVGSVGDLADPK